MYVCIQQTTGERQKMNIVQCGKNIAPGKQLFKLSRDGMKNYVLGLKKNPKSS